MSPSSKNISDNLAFVLELLTLGVYDQAALEWCKVCLTVEDTYYISDDEKSLCLSYIKDCIEYA